jgi:hypothetical protein|nr:hypothetical protein [Phenylobacterium sp.]
MGHHHRSRLVTLGENLAALVETGSLAAVALGSLARGVIGAPFRESHAGCGCGAVRHHCRCCYEPPIHRCGGC